MDPAGQPSRNPNQVRPGGIAYWVAICGGAGLLPVAPGTWGALVGVPLAVGINQLPGMPVQLLCIVLLNAVGIPICSKAARHLNQKDPSSVVWDETVSVPITFLGVSASAMRNPWVLICGLALHRLFDITKPPPARQLERLPSGLGIMADDWSAGIYSCIVLHVLLAYW